MVKGKDDFLINQFLPFALTVELESINLKMCCAINTLTACRAFIETATIILVQ